MREPGKRRLAVQEIRENAGSRNSEPITVVIDGQPVAKRRPRMTRRGFVYTPAATRKFEAHGRLSAQLAMDARPPIEGPVRLEVLAVLPVPVSWSQKKRARAITSDVLPRSRPDLDNFVKSAQDAINEIVIRDDSQIVEVGARKRYGVAPKLVMTVFPLGAACSNRGANNRATSAVTEAVEAAEGTSGSCTSRCQHRRRTR